MGRKPGKAAGRSNDGAAAGAPGGAMDGAAAKTAAGVAVDSSQRLREIFDDVTQGIAALVALASVVYLLGGAVLAGRLMMYHLPWEIVMNQLPQSFLVTIGITEVVMPLVAVGLMYLLLLYTAWKVEAFFALFPGSPATTVNRILGLYQKVTGPFGEILLWSLFGLLVLLIARLILGAANGWSVGESVIATGLAILGAIATYLVLEQFKKLTEAENEHRPLFKPLRKLGKMWADPQSKSWLRAVAVAGTLLPLIAWNAITLPIPYAQVCATKASPTASGWLIGQTNDRLILGGPDNPPGKRHILLTPSTNATIMATYQNPKLVPLPACPVIATGA